MTAEHDFKALVRARAARTGESYQAARRSLLARSSQEEPMSSTYDAAAIEASGTLEDIRRHPGRYVRDTSVAGATHLVLEVLANSLDEASAGQAHNIEVVLNSDGSATVSDDGRGIPVQSMPGTDTSALVVALAVPSSSAKRRGEHYPLPAGYNGFGLPVVVALSAWLEVIVDRDGSRYRARFESSDDAPAQVVVPPARFAPAQRPSGTAITLLPDPAVFGAASIDAGAVTARASQAAALQPGLTVRVADQREGNALSSSFDYPKGLVGLLPPEDQEQARTGSAQGPAGVAEVCWAPALGGGSWQAFANGHETPGGGDHVEAVLEVLGDRVVDLVVCVRLGRPLFEDEDGVLRLHSAKAGQLCREAVLASFG